MRGGGRVRCARAGVVGRGLVRLLCLATAFHAALAGEYGVPIEIKVWDTGRTPLAHMVDVTNSFGLKVLAEHNFLNDNNIAFSPYGLMGILVSLYEGVDGESSYQMQRAISLPWHRNVMRIGFRDIHRTLKTYFVPEEGFLAGLALNNENVTFNDNYKKILRFYGFDLDNNDQLPTLAPTNSTNATTTTTATDTTTPTSTTAMETGSTQAREDPTTNPNAETISDVDIRGQSTTASPSSAPNAEGTTITSTESTSETTQSSTVTESTTVVMTSPTSVAEETTPTATVTTQVDTETAPASSTTALSDDPTANNEVEETTPISSTTANTDSSTETTTVTSADTEMSSTQSTETSETASMTETETVSTTTDATTTAGTDSTIETLQRRKRSIVDFIYTNPPYVDDYLHHRSFEVPAEANTGGNKMFLVNGLRNVRVSYMVYDTILEHAYLPHLEASALRLPLDSDRYYLLVVLPTRMGPSELGRLLARMARESDLSDVCAALRPRRVRAIVPSFTVKGHVTLTTDLQKLGIRDVFEPRQRDFTPMTTLSGVYVRSIEQAVSVAIRKYRATDTSNSSKYLANRYPASFSATYPFLYFVMDASIHVSLMAGKMVDPLNSRIL